MQGKFRGVITKANAFKPFALSVSLESAAGRVVNADKALSIIGSVLTIALVTVLVTKPNTAKVVKAAGDSFTGLVRTAMGN